MIGNGPLQPPIMKNITGMLGAFRPMASPAMNLFVGRTGGEFDGYSLQSKFMATAYSIGAITALGGGVGGTGGGDGTKNDEGCVQLPIKLLLPETVMPQAAL
jgi:hypothetical protein